MRNTVSQTYISYYWFFIVYRFVVGLIFSQMLVGILVSVFQTTEAERGTITGEVRLALSKAAKVLTQETQAKLQRELGVLASSLLGAADPQKATTTSEPKANATTKGKDRALLCEVIARLGKGRALLCEEDDVPTTDHQSSLDQRPNSGMTPAA